MREGGSTLYLAGRLRISFTRTQRPIMVVMSQCFIVGVNVTLEKRKRQTSAQSENFILIQRISKRSFSTYLT